TLAAVAALSIAAAIVGGMGGFGTGVILAAALVPLIGVKALVPVMAVARGVINARRLWVYRGRLQRRPPRRALVSALAFPLCWAPGPPARGARARSPPPSASPSWLPSRCEGF